MIQPLDITTIQKHLDGDRLYRERRHAQWTLNYELYRDTVIVNRLTQRQSVNVPYMKETWKTYAAQTNWPVDNEYEDQGNDEQKELFLNAYWDECAERLKLDILEEVDRKQEWLYGRTFAKLNIIDSWFHMEIIDPQDVLLDRYMNPWDLQSARRIAHVGIFRTLSDIERNPLYDKNAIEELKIFFATKQGLIQAGQNALIAADKAKRLLDLGVPDVMMPILGETYVELNELQVKVWDEEKQEDVVMVVVTANGNQIIMQKPLREILGINIFTWATWAGDVERTDSWSDGGADVVRPLNLVANARWSQKVENGTLVNYGMHFYDATAKENWTPSGYDPVPFGFYPLPGKPSDILQSVDIPQMEDVFNELNWIKGEIQAASPGGSAIEAGDQDPEAPKTAQTAQEIQLLANKAKQRAQNVSKYHKRYWEDIGRIFVELVQANGGTLEKPTLFKKSPKGKYYKKTVNLADTFSKEGYKVKVGSKADKESNSLQTIQKMQLATAQFPGNAPLMKIAKEKTLDWLNLTPEETKEVMEFDEQMAAMAAARPPMSPMSPAGPTPTNSPPQQANPLDEAIAQQSKQLATQTV